MRKRAIVCLLVLFVFLLQGCSNTTGDYWPTEEWKTATPEEKGIDSGKLIEMIESIREEKKDFHSILIIRDGYLVTEAYFNPYSRDIKHNIFSASKSMSALLTGIAMEEGYIDSLRQPVLDLFPEYKNAVKNLDDRKRSLTLFHLLTMTDGLEWVDGPYLARRKGDFLSLLTADDGIRYYLDKPVKEDPGTKWNYNSGSSYMLSAIIQETTGRSALEYAREKLFEPIGIWDAYWGSYQQGISNGGSEMFLRPRDFARIGHLVLNKGNWDGKQVIPSKWVRHATMRPQVKVDFLEYGYCYQWYYDVSLPYKSTSAGGLGGQYLFVIPDLDMVVVFTASLIERDPDIIDLPFFHLRDYILPAVLSEEPLPTDPEADRKLARLLDEIEHPVPAAISPLPDIAGKISGKTFYFGDGEGEDNIWGLESVTLDFTGEEECLISYSFSGEVDLDAFGCDAVFRTSIMAENGLIALEAAVGLDGIFRCTTVDAEVGKVFYFARGQWKDDATFEVEVKGGWCLSENAVVTFKDEQNIDFSYRTLFYRFSLTGQQ